MIEQGITDLVNHIGGTGIYRRKKSSGIQYVPILEKTRPLTLIAVSSFLGSLLWRRTVVFLSAIQGAVCARWTLEHLEKT